MLYAVRFGEAADDHVGVADCLHFVHVVVFNDGVEQSVEVIQQIDNLRRNTGVSILLCLWLCEETAK